MSPGQAPNQVNLLLLSYYSVLAALLS
jgi:hypothetical protein